MTQWVSEAKHLHDHLDEIIKSEVVHPDLWNDHVITENNPDANLMGITQLMMWYQTFVHLKKKNIDLTNANEVEAEKARYEEYVNRCWEEKDKNKSLLRKRER